MPRGLIFERSSKGTNRDIDVVKVGVFVYDTVFGSSAIPKATILLIQDGGGKAIMEQLVEFNKILDDLKNIVSEGYEDAGVWVICCLEDKEGNVSYLVSDT